MAARGTRALELLAGSGVVYLVHEYDVPALGATDDRHHYGMETAAALGVPPERLYKTLVGTVDDRLAVGVVPVSAELDLKALAVAVGGRRGAMADPAAAERATGYVVGGISPLAQRRRLPIVIDDSALGQSTIFVSGGRRGLQVELAPGDLVRLTDAIVRPIRRGR